MFSSRILENMNDKFINNKTLRTMNLYSMASMKNNTFKGHDYVDQRINSRIIVDEKTYF